jgi:hypothetical protein
MAYFHTVAAAAGGNTHALLLCSQDRWSSDPFAFIFLCGTGHLMKSLGRADTDIFYYNNIPRRSSRSPRRFTSVPH